MLDIADFGLKPKPFGLLPTNTSVQQWAGMPDIKRKMGDIVISVRPDDIGAQEFAFLYGTLGGGKTHALRYFQHQINDIAASYAFYVGKVRRATKLSFFDVYRSIVSENSEMVTSFAKKVVDAVNAEIQAAYDRLPVETKEYTQVTDEEFQRNVIKKVVAPNEVALATELKNKGQSAKVAEFLMQHPKDDYSAACALASLVGLMTYPIGDQPAPYKAAYLFFDEMEDVLETKYAEHLAFFSTLRELVNRTAGYHCAIVCAFTNEAAVLETQVPSFLMDRLTRPMLEMRDMRIEEAKEFVKEYLDSARTDTVPSSAPFYPFAEGTIDFFLEREQLFPRRIIRAMGQVFERAARRGKISPGEEITPEIAEEILVSMGADST